MKTQILLILTFFSCGQTSSTTLNQEDRIELLRKYYLGAKNGEVESQKLFFKYFPETFQELNEFYGFSDEKGSMPLYDESVDHIAKLFLN